MPTLPELLDQIVTPLQVFPLTTRVGIVETEVFAENRFFCKVRAEFSHGLSFQARVYYNRGHYDYAYQLFRNAPLLRWDNKEDAPGLDNFPHHHHNAACDVIASPLQGIPELDLPVVLQQVMDYVQNQLITR